ncbi:hemolysin family protein [Picosynechococcus sp. NKBG15041c]|uniref:hemolysin family protein n=1 Tax=Picosynechococcus sp. NKBG15041c TaxID=1407650 RepID=UPI00040E55B1|nr:hemolysin family protein [Picosynechococcus sp. NKBG15041c]
MLSSGEILVRLLSVLLLIAINAFFVTAEFSIVSVRRSRISQLIATGDAQARMVQTLQSHLERLLSTTQLGITLSSLALGWIGEDTMGTVIAQALVALPLPSNWIQPLAMSVSIPLAFLLIAYLQIVLGELCPKSVALSHAEEMARWLAPPSLAIARIFKPFIWILNQSNRLLLRLGGIAPIQQGLWYDRLTPEELQLIITTEQESMGLEAEERELLSNVIEFGDVVAEEIMTPRTKVHAIAREASLQKFLQKVSQTNHSGYPVYGDSIDDIIGFIRFRDLAKPLAAETIDLNTPITPWIRPIPFVAEGTPIADLLPKMQRTKQPMVMVVDEFGGTAGLVTLKDIINEIIGDELDNHPNTPPVFKALDRQTFLVDAQIDLEELNELLSIELPYTDDYQTLSGFLLYQWQKIPHLGESFQYEGLKFQVMAIDGPRLQQVKITRNPSDIEAIAELDFSVEPESHPDVEEILGAESELKSSGEIDEF